ncbi:PTS glucitol/sorbitol transporter subunit IIA [Macrococcus capreoli]|uniref:PTS glucitol/sorbitol transporter subunit IIA n=1 Tax=Macrococcus capreoli TaxID=2982690 RepID=UPI003F441B50
MYQTVVKSIGNEANAFSAEKMIILFGENAPQELVDYCYMIEVNAVDTITESEKLYINDEAFNITKVGNAVVKNLNDLGHITLKFDGSTESEQSGTLYLEDKALPTITVGSSIIIK